MRITRHGEDRANERVGLNKKALKRLMPRVLKNGVMRAEVTGSLRRYLDKLFLKYKSGNNIRVYGEHIYIIQNRTLITVLPLPTKYKTLIKKQNAKHKKIR